jgi:predicted molibdopterin-dependent oxidoreductase YjgC
MITATINGDTAEFAEGITILSAARQLGIEIPTLCDDRRLDPVGACRMCLVEIKGTSKQAVACSTQLADGMDVLTHSEPVETGRKWNLRMLAGNYPARAFAAFPDKPFHKLALDYGLDASDFNGNGGVASDDSHTYIAVDMARCINCYACVRICADLQGQFVWHVVGRGERSEIVSDSFGAFGDSTCVSCGACADACPSGALEDKSVIQRGFPTEWTKTTCPYCGTGCEMNVGTRGDRVVQIRPVMDAPVNAGHLCRGCMERGPRRLAGRLWHHVRAYRARGHSMAVPRHGSSTVLHGESFSNGRTAALRRIKYRPTKEVVSDDFPFLLTTGRVLEHFNAGTMTMRTPNHELRPTDRLMISPTDAEHLGIADKETVRLRSAYGQAVLPAEISGKVKNGELFASFHDLRCCSIMRPARRATDLRLPRNLRSLPSVLKRSDPRRIYQKPPAVIYLPITTR